MNGYTISDEETKASLISVFKEHHYLFDPHGAYAYTALQQYQARHLNTKGVILETAHPVNFYDVIEPLINQTVPVPEIVAEQIKKEKVSTKVSAGASEVKDFLLW